MTERFEVTRHYILDTDRRPQPVHDLLEWVRWFEANDRVVKRTEFQCGVVISTVFLGTDHRHVGRGPPLLFETMVFELSADGSDEGSDDFMRRYSSWDDAVIGHAATVRRVTALIAKAGLPTEVIDG